MIDIDREISMINIYVQTHVHAHNYFYFREKGPK